MADPQLPADPQTAAQEILSVVGMVLVYVLLVFLYLGLACCAKSGPRTQELTEECLGCICTATSGCNKSLQCLGDICGAFWITKPYWEDAHKPTIPLDEPSLPGAFERCAFDHICAGEAIRNYMNRFGTDCNGDGVISCYDYASIHRLGAFGCGGHLDPPFHSKFGKCLKEIGEDLTNDVESDDYKDIGWKNDNTNFKHDDDYNMQYGFG